MTTFLTLQSGALRCEIVPALGGCIAGLWCNERPVLRSTPSAQLQSVRNSASYPLVPFSNRIGAGILHWRGRTWQLPLNFAPEAHTIHGVGWERAWAVLQADGSSAHLQYEHAADASWPFAFRAEQRFVLRPDGLELAMTVHNEAGEAAPLGLGWHPYFAKDAATHIRFHATGRWDMDAGKLPTQRRPHSGLDTDCGELVVDHCFDGWDGRVELRHAAQRITVQSDLRHLVVFTTPQRDNIAVEPVSHVNNALALAAGEQTPAQELGMQVVPAGGQFSCGMRIGIEALA